MNCTEAGLTQGAAVSTAFVLPYGDELRRAFRNVEPFGVGCIGNAFSSTTVKIDARFLVAKRSTPSISRTATITFNRPGVGQYTSTGTVTISTATSTGVGFSLDGFTALSTGLGDVDTEGFLAIDDL